MRRRKASTAGSSLHTGDSLGKSAGGDGGDAANAGATSVSLPAAATSATGLVWALGFLCTLVAVGVHIPALRCGFVFDDHLAVEANADAFVGAPAADVWLHDFWGKPMGEADSHKSYRPLTVLTLQLNDWLELTGLYPRPEYPAPVADGFAPTRIRDVHPEGYHAFNLLAHAAVTAAVFTLLWRLARAAVTCSSCHMEACTATPPREAHSERPVACDRCDRTAACATACGSLLFAVHPVHVESVVSVVGRADILCALAGSVAVLQYLEVSGSTALARPTTMLLFAASMLCKELGITFAGIFVALELLNLGERARALGPRNFRLRRRAAMVLRFAQVATVIAVYLALRLWLVATTRVDSSVDGDGAGGAFGTSVSLQGSGLIRRAENPFHFLRGRSWLLSVVYLQLRYLRMLVWPTGLCAEYSYNCIHAVERFRDPRAVATSVFAAVAAFTLAYVAKRMVFRLSSLLRAEEVVPSQRAGASCPSHRVGRLVCLSIVWWAATMSPSCHLFVTIGTLMAERLMYIPTIGACLCLTACLLVVVGDTRHLLASPGWLPSCGQPTVGRVVAAIARVLVVCAVLAAAAACTAATTRRTQDWVTDETLFVSALDVCGTSAKHHYQLGLLRMNQRNYSGAYDHFRTSRAIDPHFCDVQYGFGQYYIARDNHAMARRSLRKAIHCPYVASNAFVRLQLVWSVLLAKPVLVPSIRQEMAEVFSEIGSVDAAATNWREVAVLAMKPSAGQPLSHPQLHKARDVLSKAFRNAPHRCDLAYWLAANLEAELNLDSGVAGPVDVPAAMADTVLQQLPTPRLAELMMRYWDIIACGLRPGASDGNPDEEGETSKVDVTSSSAMIALDGLARLTSVTLHRPPFSRNHSTVAAARERLGDATAMAHQINGVPSASGSVVELTSIAASQWIQAGNSFLIAHDGASAARCFAKALLIPHPAIPCHVHMLLGRSILESLIDMDVDSPTFGRALTVDAADSQGWHVSNWTSANEEWMALAALRVASAVQEVVGVVGSGAVVGGITGMVPYGEGQAPRRGCALRVAELAQLPVVAEHSISQRGRSPTALVQPLSIGFAADQLRVSVALCGANSEAGVQARQLLSHLGVEAE